MQEIYVAKKRGKIVPPSFKVLVKKNLTILLSKPSSSSLLNMDVDITSKSTPLTNTH